MSPRTRSPKPPQADDLDLSGEVLSYLEQRGIPLPACPPLIKTPEPRRVRGAQFSFERVDRVLAAFNILRHTQGTWAGLPLRPDPWQVAYIIAPTFGWVKRNRAGRWVRIINTLYVEVPRKNGKTTLSGGIAIYLTAADGESGAQVLAAATTKEQAAFMFAPVKALATSAPGLRGHVLPRTGKILHPRSGSYFQVISSIANAQHGANVHGGLIDELHVHKTAELVEAIETGTGSREQPLIVIITTADSGAPGTIYDRKRTYIEQLARRTIKDTSTYGVVWSAEKGDDPFVEATWRKANPGYGISPTPQYLERKALQAQHSPAELATFLRLHLGLRTKQETRYIPLEVWDASAGTVDEDTLAGRPCYGGLDLSSVEDLTALAWLFPDEDNGVDVIWRFWLPSDRLPSLSRRTAGEAEVWVRDGWLQLTPGNVIDNDAVQRQITTDAERFDVQTIGFDRYGATDLTRRLGDEGIEMVPVSQGVVAMTGPMRETLRLLLERRYRHGGNPLMRWMIDNLAVAMDTSGGVKPAKNTSHEKIDGVSAAMNALKEWLDSQAVEADDDLTAGYYGGGVEAI